MRSVQDGLTERFAMIKREQAVCVSIGTTMLAGAAVAQDVESIALAADPVAIQEDYPSRVEHPDGSFAEEKRRLVTFRVAQTGACEGQEIKVLFDEEAASPAARSFPPLSLQSDTMLEVSPEVPLAAPEEIHRLSEGAVDVIVLTSRGRPVQRTALEAPEITARLEAYAQKLIDRVEWPIEFVSPIYLLGDGYLLQFRTTIGPENVCGYTSQQAAEIRRIYPQYVRDWQAGGCTPELLESVEGETLTAAMTVYAGGIAVGGMRYTCNAEQRR
jgi:hypothetical protein